MRLGVLGGTFNPIHLGHLILAQTIAEAKQLDKILFVPAQIPPLKKIKVAARHRYRMVELAIAENSLFEISDVEIKRDQTSYTIDTLNILQEQDSQNQLAFIIGADNIIDLPKWHKWQQILEHYEIIIGQRPNSPEFSEETLQVVFSPKQIQKLQNARVATPLIEISSTNIRQRLKQGKSICYLSPPSVADYIYQNGLYTS